MSTTDVWLTARGAGLSALVLLTMSTALGAFVSRHRANGPDPSPARRYLVQYLHRAFAGLGLGVLVLHIATILADSYAHVGVTGALVPFTSGYRAGAVALGTLAGYGFVAVSALGLARGRMAASPRAARVWRALHGLAYAGWAAAMLHGFTAGTDTAVGWVRNLYAVCLIAVLGSVAVRLLTGKPAPAGDRFAGRGYQRPSRRPYQGATR
jgi:sulfoxide reductase heme-binding subunit YedZ